jgi:glutathione peroxidase
MTSWTPFFATLPLAAVVTLAAAAPAPQQPAVAGPAGGGGPAGSSLYDLRTTSLLGEPADLGSYRGKVTLVVNVASECGYTPQYQGLEKLHRELSGKGFAVLGFPSNDFGGQEPGTPQQIATFCRLTYDVTFPMFAKVSTLAGPSQSPIYKFLGTTGHLPAWNFTKYVVGKDGKVVAFFPSEVTPEAPALRNAIAKALGSQ